jgi:hypothetical protein
MGRWSDAKLLDSISERELSRQVNLPCADEHLTSVREREQAHHEEQQRAALTDTGTQTLLNTDPWTERTRWPITYQGVLDRIVRVTNFDITRRRVCRRLPTWHGRALLQREDGNYSNSIHSTWPQKGLRGQSLLENKSSICIHVRMYCGTSQEKHVIGHASSLLASPNELLAASTGGIARAPVLLIGSII